MDKKERIREEVDRTLEMMDRLENLEAGPYFYTRLEARLAGREKEKSRWLTGILDVANLRPAFLVLLMIINMVTAVYFLLEHREPESGREEYGTYAAVFLEDYSMNKNTYDTVITEKMSEGKMTGENK